MKKLSLLLSLLAFGTFYAQENAPISSKNSWLKFGINAALPIGDTSDYSSFGAGLDIRGQYLVTPHFGIGIASGYNHFFGKEGADDFGLVPLAGFARYYFSSAGIFIGADFGYGFLTNVEENEGGMYLNPQIGYHNRDWNIYGFFQQTSAENDLKIQTAGIGITYNIRFK